MAQITDGKIKLKKTAGPSQQETRVIVGPVPPEELQYRQNTSAGERFKLTNFFTLHEDDILVVSFYHATKVSVVASLLLKLTCLQTYKGLDGRPQTLDLHITEEDITAQVNTAGVETEIFRYQCPKGVSLSFRVNDQFYLYLADA